MLCEWVVGDKIRCIDDRLTNGLLKKGRVYKIIAIEHEPTSVNMDYVYVGTKGQDGWPFRAFELANKRILKEGTKYDARDKKIRYDLIDAYALEELAKVFTYGATKYADRNWELGMKWSRIFGACMRHLWAFWRGEMFSKDDKLPHLAQAMWCCMVLLHYSKYKKEFDDRPLK